MPSPAIAFVLKKIYLGFCVILDLLDLILKLSINFFFPLLPSFIFPLSESSEKFLPCIFVEYNLWSDCVKIYANFFPFLSAPLFWFSCLLPSEEQFFQCPFHQILKSWVLKIQTNRNDDQNFISVIFWGGTMTSTPHGVQYKRQRPGYSYVNHENALSHYEIAWDSTS